MRFLLLPLLFLLPACAPPPEPVVYAPPALPQISGVISGQQEVSGEMVLVDDLRILPGSSLTFAAGSLVWVRPAESTKMDPEYLSSLTEILVAGSLHFAGNSEHPVRFQPLKPADPVAEGDPLWAGIELLPGSSAELSGFELHRADVGVLVQQADARLSGGKFHHCRNGLVIQNGARLSAEKLQVRNGEVGLFCWDKAVLALADSDFSAQQEEGLYLAANCTARMRSVVSRNNAVGLVAAGSFWPGLELRENRQPQLQLQGGGR